MMTSNAMSKVMNMMRENRNPVTSAFHSAMRASDQPHEARDQHEARHIETEPLHEHAEKQGRHENLHHAAELFAGHKGLARSSLHEQLVDQSVEARGAEKD